MLTERATSLAVDSHANYPELDREALRALDQLIGGDRAVLIEILDAFLEDAPERLGDLDRAAETGDEVAASRAAHTLKSNGRTFGASELAELCQELESAARAGDLESVRRRLPELNECWTRTRGALLGLRNDHWPPR